MDLIENKIFQFAWVVNDLDDAITRWACTLGVGPFFKIGKMQLQSAKYRGKPSSLEFGVAIAYSGDTQIELIAPLDSSPSAYRDKFPAGAEGFHHVAIPTNEYESRIEIFRQQGFEVVNECIAASGARFAYVDTSQTMGHMLEVVELTPGLRSLSSLVFEASKNWNGKEPIRVLG